MNGQELMLSGRPRYINERHSWKKKIAFVPFVAAAEYSNDWVIIGFNFPSRLKRKCLHVLNSKKTPKREMKT